MGKSENTKLKLTTIELETQSGQKIRMTVEEAKDLYKELGELFGPKTTIMPSYPIIIDRHWPHYWPPNIWCKTGTDNSIRYASESNMTITLSGETFDEPIHTNSNSTV